MYGNAVPSLTLHSTDERKGYHSMYWVSILRLQGTTRMLADFMRKLSYEVMLTFISPNSSIKVQIVESNLTGSC